MTGVRTVKCQFCKFTGPVVHTDLGHRSRHDFGADHRAEKSATCSQLRSLNGEYQNNQNVPDILNTVNWDMSSTPTPDMADVIADLARLGISYHEAKYPQLADVTRRYSTFITYPVTEGVIIDTNQLADAGYLYAGSVYHQLSPIVMNIKVREYVAWSDIKQCYERNFNIQGIQLV